MFAWWLFVEQNATSQDTLLTIILMIFHVVGMAHSSSLTATQVSQTVFLITTGICVCHFYHVCEYTLK